MQSLENFLFLDSSSQNISTLMVRDSGRSNTVVPRLTAIIGSRKIAVKQKHRKTKLNTPLKRTETCSMRSNGVKTHHPAKILHTVAIFAACIARNLSLSTAGSHFKHLVAILKPRRSAVFDCCKAKSREPIIAKRNSSI